MHITTREISELTPTEQQHLSRWIGEQSHLAELAGHHANNRAIRRAMDLEETDGEMQMYLDRED